MIALALIPFSLAYAVFAERLMSLRMFLHLLFGFWRSGEIHNAIWKRCH